MKTAQERILDRIESIVVGLGYECSMAKAWANVGEILLYEPGTVIAVGAIHFNFQDATFKVSITHRGRKLLSQPPRNDYFDWYQRYDEPTTLWTTIAALPKALAAKRQLKRGAA